MKNKKPYYFCKNPNIILSHIGYEYEVEVIYFFANNVMLSVTDELFILIGWLGFFASFAKSNLLKIPVNLGIYENKSDRKVGRNTASSKREQTKIHYYSAHKKLV